SATNDNAEPNGVSTVTSGSDVTVTSSGVSSGLNTPRDNQCTSNGVPPDHATSLASKTLAANGSTTPVYGGHQQPQYEWSVDSDPGLSIDGSTNSSNMGERSQQSTDAEVEKLKGELVAMARQIDLSDLELQTLRKQIVKESKRGHDLSRELKGLKEERDAIHAECEQLKVMQKGMEEAKVKNKSKNSEEGGGDPWLLIGEIRQELYYEKDRNANLQLQLQKTQDSNAELLLALKELDEMLAQKGTTETPNVMNDVSKSELQNCIKSLEGERKLQEQSKKELKDEIKRLENEVNEQQNEYNGSLSIINGLQYHIKKLEEEMKMQEESMLQHEAAATEKEELLETEIGRLENELKEKGIENVGSLATINELQNHIKSLENEFKKQQKQNSTSLATIKELETHISSLEDELEQQAQTFEADLATITRERVDQEQRAIRAEEALKLTRWKNSNTAEKLQEEFKRLSKQMASTFEANESVAMKAMEEANEVRIQKIQLEDMVRRAKSELQSVKDDYEEKLVELSNQLNLKTQQVEKLVMEIDDKSKQLERQKQHEEQLGGTSNKKVQKLQDEIEKLVKENNFFSTQVEEMKGSIKNYEELVQNRTTERNELVKSIAVLKKEAEKSAEDLRKMRSIQDEKETTLDLLKAEVERLQCQCDDLKHSLIEDEMEKEKLRMQLVCLKGDLKKKDEALISSEKKLKDCKNRALIASRTNKSAALAANGTKEVSNLKEKIRLLEVTLGRF
ncbi:Laminin-like protein epi-1, partial [Linum perenne]